MRVALFSVAVAFLLGACTGSAVQIQPSNGEELIEEAKANVVDRLKDPNSAQFKDLAIYETEKGVIIVCGKVNAKNSMGGYTGFKTFTYRDGNAGIVDVSGDAAGGVAFAKALSSVTGEFMCP